jgi:serine phosphatase RsbU (regulator of sigma subunit)
VPEITDEMLVAAARDEEHLRLARELQLRSAVTVPLLARGRAFGVMTWVSAESGLRYTDADVTFAEDLAKRAATAIDNAQLYSQTKETAVRLQQAVLPDLSASIPGWEVASVYDPAGRTDVGGDFYDALPLPDGRLALFVGDVMGRGVTAAAAMAQIRSAIRAHIAVDPTPEVVLNRLDLLFATYPISQLVTLVYAVLDPTVEELQFINAGHPAAVLVRPDGSLQQLPDAGGAPLGLQTAPRQHLTYPFRAGDALLTFTDGLIERRHEDIDQGQNRLLAAAQDLVQAPLQEGLARLVQTVRDPTRDDDVAALVVKRVP